MLAPFIAVATAFAFAASSTSSDVVTKGEPLGLRILSNEQTAEDRAVGQHVQVGGHIDGETFRASVSTDSHRYGAATGYSGNPVCLIRYEIWRGLDEAHCIPTDQLGSTGYIIRRYGEVAHDGTPTPKLALLVGDDFGQVHMDGGVVLVVNNMVVVADHAGISEVLLVGQRVQRAVELPAFPVSGTSIGTDSSNR